MRSLALAFCFLLAFGMRAEADEGVVAVRALSGDELALHDGRILRLYGVKGAAPQARAFLDNLAVGKNLNLRDETKDRYGRVVATVYAEGEAKPLQEALLSEGMACVFASTLIPDDWMNAERDARRAGKGYWAENRDIPAEEALKTEGTYRFVIGNVTKAERVKNKVYLSLGDAPGLTVIIAAKFIRVFGKQGIDLFALPGQKVRVRGWVNATATEPAITIGDTHQVEVAP